MENLEKNVSKIEEEREDLFDNERVARIISVDGEDIIEEELDNPQFKELEDENTNISVELEKDEKNSDISVELAKIEAEKEKTFLESQARIAEAKVEIEKLKAEEKIADLKLQTVKAQVEGAMRQAMLDAEIFQRNNSLKTAFVKSINAKIKNREVDTEIKLTRSKNAKWNDIQRREEEINQQQKLQKLSRKEKRIVREDKLKTTINDAVGSVITETADRYKFAGEDNKAVKNATRETRIDSKNQLIISDTKVKKAKKKAKEVVYGSDAYLNAVSELEVAKIGALKTPFNLINIAGNTFEMIAEIPKTATKSFRNLADENKAKSDTRIAEQEEETTSIKNRTKERTLFSNAKQKIIEKGGQLAEQGERVEMTLSDDELKYNYPFKEQLEKRAERKEELERRRAEQKKLNAEQAANQKNSSAPKKMAQKEMGM